MKQKLVLARDKEVKNASTILYTIVGLTRGNSHMITQKSDVKQCVAFIVSDKHQRSQLVSLQTAGLLSDI